MDDEELNPLEDIDSCEEHPEQNPIQTINIKAEKTTKDEDSDPEMMVHGDKTGISIVYVTI